MNDYLMDRCYAPNEVVDEQDEWALFHDSLCSTAGG